ncbi:hypothetical protein [Paenibacillus sp. OV219]|uniref:hypothetical protein n=1 Tax=Paenibacillus sp. OV219 TaxID=1884377 RepID=UPI0008D8B1BA|nr:hypothetical protein [Paenibacillus sp. OV219]SEO35635.1 hypothetical protein SAMN05518847_107184 [Paenibacillus sp. OV219]
MPKSTRGKSLWNTPSHGRGTCPACGTTRIKLLYSRSRTDGKIIKVCKLCRSASQAKLDGTQS